jgi:uncharacterized protein (TIGR02391 family)
MAEHLHAAEAIEITFFQKDRGGPPVHYISVDMTDDKNRLGSRISVQGTNALECERIGRGLQQFILKQAAAPQAQSRSYIAGRLDGMHPSIRDASEARLATGHGDDAVLAACKVITQRLRQMTGLTDDGQRLITGALGGTTPRIYVRRQHWGDEGDSAYQQSFMHLGMALYQAGRNPRAHLPSSPESHAESIHWLWVASLLCGALDEATT